ncbi:MAG: 4-hydroxythreonine-4-phosphate dehydrogenase PdxA [Thermodesulfobacteriota bacterium]
MQHAGTPPHVIGITMGCPVGVGPEILLRFLAGDSTHAFTPVVLGDLGVLHRTAQLLGMETPVVAWQPGTPVQPGAVNVHSLSDLGSGLRWGQPDAGTGRAMARYIEEAVRLIAAGELAAMVTCPIAKSALKMAGYSYPGHTEMLAAFCGASDYAMMMAGGSLRVTLVTIHQALVQAAAALSQAAVEQLIAITHSSLMRDFALAEPRIAVAGLNPHAGEGGLFGREEEEVIAPAVRTAAARGWQVSGPLPPDTVFYRASQGQFDAVVAMYHDQGLIPFKLLHFRDGVNVTLGLPIVRTSVDHGTAYDIAGKGIADAASLAAAFALAGVIVENRRRAATERRGTA